MAAMTAQEFIEYWCAPMGEDTCMSYLDAQRESLAEHEAQYRSECALFGDAGPGQGYRLNKMKAELAQVERQLERLSGR